MGMGTSIFLIAIGAILAFAVNVETEGVNLNTIGMILLIVGAIGAVLSMIFWQSWGGFNTSRTVERGGSRRRVIEEDV